MELNSHQAVLGSSHSQLFDSSDVSAYARDSSSSRQQQQHDNSFWRSKVGRRWSGSSSAMPTSCGSNNDCDAVGGQEQSTVIVLSGESEDVTESA